MLLKTIITEACDNMRLDQALAILISDYSRSQLQEWIKQGFVTVDGITVDQTRKKVMAGQEIAIEAVLQAQQSWQGQDLPLDIIYEDDDIIVINKPVNCVVHPGAGNPDNTLVNA
ncbi:MAG: 23S rRNA pseudouridine(1911/1915/1917) synthase RluD, partial [Gammaproteobacteria bacterium]|nr:23S rRNA pseudouridine(1911/1915/1917) synthase RluD [Gammaproteobacteria bacterium]